MKGEMIMHSFFIFLRSYLFLIFAMHPIFAGGAMNDNNNKKTFEIPLYKAQFVSHGGMGIISDSIYIVVRSQKNELLMPNGQRWIGSDHSSKQMVCVMGNVVYEDASKWKGFDLAKMILVSFEGDRIYFFDFKNLIGGFYLRGKPLDK